MYVARVLLATRLDTPYRDVLKKPSEGFVERGVAPSHEIHSHLVHPQDLQTLQPPWNSSSAPHLGQGFLIYLTGASSGASSGIPRIWVCISLYMSISAQPTAMGQQDPREVSLLVWVLTT